LYTGYTLEENTNNRSAFAPSRPGTIARFTLRLTVPRPIEGRGNGLPSEGFTAVMGAMWLLGHLGGLGSRARRAWGSVQLTKIHPAVGREIPAAFQEVLNKLEPVVAGDASTWLARVKQTLDWLRGQFPGERKPDATTAGHFGKTTWLRL